jgi:hypothetical protein
MCSFAAARRCTARVAVADGHGVAAAEIQVPVSGRPSTVWRRAPSRGDVDEGINAESPWFLVVLTVRSLPGTPREGEGSRRREHQSDGFTAARMFLYLLLQMRNV